MKEVGKIDNIGEVRTPKTELSDIPKVSITEDNIRNPFDNTTSVFDDVFRSFGLVSETDESAEKNESTEDAENPYSDYLEKGEDGKFYDKETGKSYESVEDWVKEQKTLAKRYLSTADYFESKAKKEWAKYKNAEENGESDAEKWKHYQESQKYYAKAQECREKGNKILEKIGGSENTEKDTGDMNDKKTDSNENLENNTARELTEDEKNYLKETLGWTDKQLEKCTIDENGKIYYKTDREDLEGKTSDNGVRYERKTVEINGVKIEGVFPVFQSAYDVQLPKELEQSSNIKQFKECNKQLLEAIENSDELKKQFTDEQLEDIYAGRTPEGYVWHHNEETGKMQLVKVEEHDRTQGGAAHTGGKSLWGGGYSSNPTASNNENFGME